MLPTIPTTPRTPLTSRPLLRYRFALCTYGCRCFALINFFLRSAFTTGTATVAMFTLAAVAACITRRFTIAGSYSYILMGVLIVIRVVAKQHGYAEAGRGKQFKHG